MKVLNTNQQTDLLQLLTRLADDEYQADLGDIAQIQYWALELKPKRLRRKVKEVLDNPQ